MEKNEAAGRTPSSLPLSTPPPAAMNLSSPKFGPLSPVNANVLNDTRSQNTKVEPSNFSLPPSYAEDERAVNSIMSRGPASDNSELRHYMGEQRNDSFLPGGNLDFVHFFLNLRLCLNHGLVEGVIKDKAIDIET